MLLLKPSFGVATPDAYRRWADSRELDGIRYAAQVFSWGELVNDLERPVYWKHLFLAEMKAWLADRMQRDDVLIQLARALTSESWTTGLGGFGSLGDRVSRRQVRVSIRDDFDLFDPDQFRIALERIAREQRQPEEDLEVVRVFLEAWAKKGSRDFD